MFDKTQITPGCIVVTSIGKVRVLSVDQGLERFVYETFAGGGRMIGNFSIIQSVELTSVEEGNHRTDKKILCG